MVQTAAFLIVMFAAIWLTGELGRHTPEWLSWVIGFLLFATCLFAYFAVMLGGIWWLFYR